MLKSSQSSEAHDAMKKSLRTLVEPDYLQALGHAIYNFACLEWNIVWLADALKPGYVFTIQNHRKTVGRIAADFQRLVKKSARRNPTVADELNRLSETFLRLVKERDRLVHGKPATTSPTGEQCLVYAEDGRSMTWNEAAILDVAQEFEAAATEANALFCSWVPGGVLQHEPGINFGADHSEPSGEATGSANLEH